MRELLNKLINFQSLTSEEASNLVEFIVAEETNDALIVSAMTALRMRNVNATELNGFREGILRQAIIPELNGENAIDVCGTGGDSKNAFNISTLSAIVLAGAGYNVIKHGNYGVSSFCGSSTVLEKMGYHFKSDDENLKGQLREQGLCFLHAPLFHPSLKRVGQIRKDLGMRTFFNFLGPLVNPVQPKYQLTGVFNFNIARLYAQILENERKGFNIIHSTDGYDEISLTSPFKVFSNKGEFLLKPQDIGYHPFTQKDLFGGDSIDDSLSIFNNVLDGKGTKAQSEVVIANTAFGISCFDRSKEIKDCLSEARESLMSGKAREKFNRVIEISKN